MLSHLFNQGLVSAEALLQDGVREQFLRIAAERGITLPDDYEPKRVVFATLLKSGHELSADTLFPFAQLALRHTARILHRRGIRVELVGIRLSGS